MNCRVDFLVLKENSKSFLTLPDLMQLSSVLFQTILSCQCQLQ